MAIYTFYIQLAVKNTPVQCAVSSFNVDNFNVLTVASENPFFVFFVTLLWPVVFFYFSRTLYSVQICAVQKNVDPTFQFFYDKKKEQSYCSKSF